MNNAERRGIFLEKRSYRRRRIVDGLRLLPLVGAWLFLVPVLWPQGEGAPPMSSVLTYVFGAWVVLILAAGVLIWAQRRLGSDPDTAGDGAANDDAGEEAADALSE